MTHCRCSCGATGTYPWSTAPKTDAALPDAKHVKACGQAVVTATGEGVLARWAG